MVACGSNSAETKESATSNEESKASVQIDNLGHEVEIPKDPQRIVGSYLEDFLVALEVTPVAQWTVGGGSRQMYLQEQLEDLPLINYDLPYEDLLALEPDLVLVESDPLVEGDKYAEYSKIDATYVVKNGEGITWRNKLNDIAAVLNKEEKAEEVIADYETLVEETKTDYADKIQGKSVAILWVTNNSAFMVAKDRSSGDLVYNQLGFAVPELVAEVSATAEADFSAVSLEKLAELDADYLILVNSDQGAAMFDDQIWQNLPAVKNGNLWEFSSESSWLYNGPIAYTEMIEDVKEQLK
ncbi:MULTISPECIES: ABC transporter substrate-binding protein [unclassified Enterococcus]|uniref:ABC transporter substrate-binding protein n=1 Tax=unclassified Enterococcus TaxID=2608891 RepID=UPI002475980C|nr:MULTISPECIES: ABC transporter substrate-binding protein [unclassified Enterococcus]